VPKLRIRCIWCFLILSKQWKYVDEMDIIAHYFMRGFQYSAILSLLRKFRNIEMSLRTLKSRLQSMGLKRWNVDEEEVTTAIQEELNAPGCLHGYQSMWHCLCFKYGVQAQRSMVQHILLVGCKRHHWTSFVRG
jgi:hypothetical protein